MRVKALIQSDLLTRDKQLVLEPSYRVKLGEQYRLVIPPVIEPSPQAQKIPLKIVYEDSHVMVIDKQAGIVVHPAPGNLDCTLVNAILHHCGEFRFKMHAKF